ncbi:hypothetical protein GOBAR_DD19215 [Gossypium barbadense]|nr:hypothetical protein GOBAR_DD19215 [Gossypium barbadense]
MSMPVRGKGKTDHCFDNVDHALSLFNKMIENQMELLGVSHDVYSVSISINCFCQLGRIDFGFSVLGKMLKLGVEPDVLVVERMLASEGIKGIELGRDEFEKRVWEWKEKFRPRILIDVNKIDMTTTVLGFKISMPIMIAPTAMQKMAHPEDSSLETCGIQEV